MHAYKPISEEALFRAKNEEYIFLKRGQGRIKRCSFDQSFPENKKLRRDTYEILSMPAEQQYKHAV